MDKVSSAEVGEVMKMTANTLRVLSEENQDLKSKVSHFEKRELAEKIASDMQEKGLQPELSYKQKVAGLLEREDLNVVAEAVHLTAPQTKLASVADGSTVEVEGVEATSDAESGRAEQNFFTQLATDG